MAPNVRQARQPHPSAEDLLAQDLRTLARGSTLNLAGSLVAAVLNLVLPVIITRGLVKDDAGVFFQVTSLFTVLVSVGTLGSDTGLLRSIPQSIALNRTLDVRALMRISTVAPVLASAVIALVFEVFAGPIGELATGQRHSAAGTLFSHSIMLLSPFLPVAVAYAIALSASRGLGSVLPLVVVEKLVRGVLQVGAIAVAAIVGGSALLLLMAWTLPYVAALAILFVWIIRSTRVVAAKIAGRAADTQTSRTAGLSGDFWRFSLPRALSRIFSVALQRFDILIVGSIRGPAEAAVYAAATRFPILGLMFVQAIQQVMAPRISEFLARGDHDRALAMYRTTTCWLTLVSWPTYLLSVWYAAVLLGVFGPGYTHATAVVVILCLSMLVATACGPVDMVLLMGGRSVLSLINTGLSLTVTITLDLLLVPGLGITGAAIGWMVGIFINNLLPLWQVNRFLHMQPLDRALGAAIAVTVGSYGMVAMLVRLFLGEDLLSLVVATVASTLTFAVCLFRLRSLLELDALVMAMRKRPRPAGSAST